MPGRKLGTSKYDIRGLKVSLADELTEVGAHGAGKKTNRKWPPGWYVCVQFKRGQYLYWEAVLQLRFAREVDAVRAATALGQAGLDSAQRMKRAGAETVIRVAMEALQW